MSNILLYGDESDPLHPIVTARCTAANLDPIFYTFPKKQAFQHLDVQEYADDLMESVETGSFDLSFTKKFGPEPFVSEKSYYDVVLAYELDPYESVSNVTRQYLLKKIKLGFDGVILVPAYAANVDAISNDLKGWENKIIGYSPLGLFTGQTGVELVQGYQATPTAMQKAQSFFDSLGLVPLVVENTPGLIFPRTIAMVINEAIWALSERIATPEDIDTAMQLGTNYPQGPLAWADQIGLDVILKILEHLWHTTREERYRPCGLLQRMVLQGTCGQKSAQGFYHTPRVPLSLEN